MKNFSNGVNLGDAHRAVVPLVRDADLQGRERSAVECDAGPARVERARGVDLDGEHPVAVEHHVEP